MSEEHAWDPGPASEGARALAEQLGMCITAADVLFRRGAEAGDELARWLDPKLAHLTPPAAMADLDIAVARIVRAVRNRERICIYGDYDCDGITSTAILTEVLRAVGGEVTPVLASRFAGGYGFSERGLERVRATGASLLITCDCGSSDHPRLAAAAKSGIDAVVIDHHLVPDEPLPAVAFLNPHRPDCDFPYKGLASCGLALFVATAIRKGLGVELDVRQWLDLVAIGTVADVAPLDGDNRVLVRAGLKVLGRAHRPGLRSILGRVRGGQAPTSELIAFQVAPRLNAPGRLTHPDLALELLLARTPDQAWSLGERVEELTLERRAIQRRIVDEAEQEVVEKGWAEGPALVLANRSWHVGIVGIVAGRLADRFDKPTVVVALDDDGGRGSARGPDGFRLYDALAASAEHLLGFGGHQAAAGIEIAEAAVESFRAAFSAACAEQLSGAPPAPPRHLPEVRCDPTDDPMALLVDLERLEPCGEANPRPKLLFRDLEVKDVRTIREHLRLDVMLGPHRVSAFGPAMADRSETVPPAVTLVGRLKRDHYRGGGLPEILIEALL